jgi:hypothetical protein
MVEKTESEPLLLVSELLLPVNAWPAPPAPTVTVIALPEATEKPEAVL